MKTKTPPTIPAPLPTDHRLLRLAGLLKVSRRDALGATVDAWAWIAAQASEGIVPQPVVLLDSVAEIEGYGEAAVAVGLVGTADGHIVAPAELRQADAQGSARRAGTADDDDRDRKRRQARERQRRLRSGSRLTGKAKTPTPTDAAAATSTTPSRKSRRLGSVAPGQDIMLLWSKRNGEYFYKCTGATPDLTGTVVDQDNPSLAAALKALMDARLTQAKRDEGKLSQTAFSPSMEQLVEAARRERDARQAEAAAAARVDEANDALAEAAHYDADQEPAEPATDGKPAAGSVAARVDDEPSNEQPTKMDRLRRACTTLRAAQEIGAVVPVRTMSGVPVMDARRDAAEPGSPTADIEPEGVAERDSHAHVTPVTRDTVTCHAFVTLADDASTLPTNGLGADFCHAPVTLGAPSSSSSLSSMNQKREDTTTTSVTGDHERDAHGDQGDDFSRYLTAASPAVTGNSPPPLSPEAAALLGRFADALGSTPEAIREQARRRPDILSARLKVKGIDSRTGFPLASYDGRAGEDAPTSPQDAPGSPDDYGTHVQSVSSGRASGGIVGAPATTTPPGSPNDDHDGDGIGSRFRDAVDAVTAGLQGGADADHDYDDGNRDAEQALRLEDAEQARRRNELLRAIHSS